MENFNYYNPTNLHFGEGVCSKLGKSAKKLGTRALLVYGKGSIKENGLYQKVVDQLTSENIYFCEYAGIKPNPIIEDVNKAVILAQQEKIDLVIAIGGGSVIDSAKIISLAMHIDGQPWEMVVGDIKPKKATPLIAVLTLAATGSEMNPFAVIQNPITKQKIGFGHPLAYPTESFLDPANTLSVSLSQTRNGIVDTIAHSLEAWFGGGEAALSDKFVISIIKETMDIAIPLLNDLTNIELRARLMFASTFALNGITFLGRKNGDWGVHDLGHILSVLYDLPHGQTLSIAYPAWMKAMRPKIEDRVVKLGQELFGANSYEETIDCLETFFSKIKTPMRLQDVGIGLEKVAEIADLMQKNKVSGNNILFKNADYLKITKKMFEKTKY